MATAGLEWAESPTARSMELQAAFFCTGVNTCALCDRAFSPDVIAHDPRGLRGTCGRRLHATRGKPRRFHFSKNALKSQATKIQIHASNHVLKIVKFSARSRHNPDHRLEIPAPDVTDPLPQLRANRPRSNQLCQHGIFATHRHRNASFNTGTCSPTTRFRT